MNINPVILSIPIYFLLIGVELMVQWYSKKKLYRINDAITNISCGITQQLSGIFFKVLGVGAYTIIYNYFALFDIPSTWYTFLILFVGADFFYYWAHRKSHEINLFWGGHVVHHQSEDYNFSVALRQGSFQTIWTFAFYLPLALIGFKPVDFVFVSALVTVYQFWIHTETINKMGWFELVFNTPSHHRVHHGRDPKYIDKNHAGVFIIWDKLFGTFQHEEEKPTYGITRPVNSWNPLWVNLDHYHNMYNEFRSIKGFKNKLKYLFYKPGWLPEEMGGYHPPSAVDKSSYQKFNTFSDKHLNYYILIQYVVALGATAFFLFNYAQWTLVYQLLGVTGIGLTVLSAGGLLENKPWSLRLEMSRHILIFIGSMLFSYLYNINTLWIVSTLYILISIFTFPRNQLKTSLHK